jgi:hypothetical protein
VVGVALAVVVLGLTATSVGAFSRTQGSEASRGKTVFRSNLIGVPASLKVLIRGVPAGGFPWTVSEGSARVTGGGQLTVDVEGLLITGTDTKLDGTTGPVKSVFASLTCEGASPTSPVVVSTTVVPLSPEGDSEIHQHISLPSTCLAPIVLIRANLDGFPWIAATGFTSG